MADKNISKIKLGDVVYNLKDALADDNVKVYKVTTDEVSSVQDLRTLFESHKTANKNYVYDLSAFDDSVTIDRCLIEFIDINSNSFFKCYSLTTGRMYSDSIGYLYRSPYPLNDYFNGMNIGYAIRIIKVTRTDLTFAFIETALAQMEAGSVKVMFDLSSLLKGAYLCTIMIDADNHVAKVQDILHGRYSKISYTDETLLTDIFAYIETPLKVYAELPAAGDYVGDMCLVKNYGWKDLVSDDELIVGKTYRLKIPANTACFSFSGAEHWVEVLNMTVKTSGKEAQTYTYEEKYDDIVHTGSFATDSAFYIVTSIDKTNRTFVGYDFTTSTGDTEFLATGVYNGKNITVNSTGLSLMALQQDNYSSPKIWNGAIWSDLASKYDINVALTDVTRVVDISSYSVGDVISDDLAAYLEKYQCNIRYNSMLLRYVRTTDETASGYSTVYSYEGIEFNDYHPYLRCVIIGKSTKDSKWYLIAYEVPKLAAYSPDTDILGIYLKDETFRLVSDDQTKEVKMIRNTAQTESSISLTLPSTTGTLALTSDAEVTKDKITTALGYTPVNKTDSDLSYYYTKTEVDEKIKESGGGTSVTPNPTTTTSDPDLSTLGISTTNYNINAKKLDGHDVDDLTAIINAAYVPDVTVDSMNTAIDTKIQAALDSLNFNRYYTGTTSPASDFGNDGDLYLQQ